MVQLHLAQVVGSYLYGSEHTVEIMADSLNFLDKNGDKVHFEIMIHMYIHYVFCAVYIVHILCCNNVSSSAGLANPNPQECQIIC